MNTEFSLIEQSYVHWNRSPESTKASSFRLNKTDVTFIFMRGREIHSKNGWTPGVIPNRIYVTCEDNDRIKTILGKIFASEPAGSPRQNLMHHFTNHPDNVFELHYYSSIEAIRAHIAETDNKFSPKQEHESCALS